MDSDINHSVWYILPLLSVVNKGSVSFATSIVGAHVTEIASNNKYPTLKFMIYIAVLLVVLYVFFFIIVHFGAHIFWIVPFLTHIYVCAFQYAYLSPPPIFCAFLPHLVSCIVSRIFSKESISQSVRKSYFGLCLLNAYPFGLVRFGKQNFDCALLNAYFRSCLYIQILRDNFDCSFLNAQIRFFWNAYPNLCVFVPIPIIPMSNSIR